MKTDENFHLFSSGRPDGRSFSSSFHLYDSASSRSSAKQKARVESSADPSRNRARPFKSTGTEFSRTALHVTWQNTFDAVSAMAGFGHFSGGGHKPGAVAALSRAIWRIQRLDIFSDSLDR